MIILNDKQIIIYFLFFVIFSDRITRDLILYSLKGSDFALVNIFLYYGWYDLIFFSLQNATSLLPLND